MRSITKLPLFILLYFAFLSFTAFSQSSVKLRHYNTEDGMALKGYDPVAYFNKNKAVKGSKNIEAVLDGIKYYFSTQENKELFIKSPGKFEPQYGGWCAYAIGTKGEKVSVDPKTFDIKDGKLYLFYNAYFSNTLPLWKKNEVNLKINADQKWAAIFK